MKSHAVSTGCAGQTFLTLTTSVETLNGTANNDTVNGSLVFNSSEAATTDSTYSVADTLNLGAGTDTLNLTISGAQDAGVTVVAPSITGLETFNIRNTVAQTASLDASTVGAPTAVNADRSVGAVTVTNLAAGASAGMIGDGSVTNGAFNPGYAATATAATLNVSGGTTAGAVTISGTGVTGVTVNSTGAKNTIGAVALPATATTLTINADTNLTTGAISNTTAAKATTVTITGAGAVDTSAGAFESTVVTVDASKNTGGVTVAASSAATAKFTGGTGNDVFTTGAVLTTGSADGGAGTDVLDIGTNVSHINTAALAAKYTNFETLRIGAATLDMTNLGGFTGIQMTGAATLTGLTAAQAGNIQVRADQGATSIALADSSGTADVVSIAMGTGLTTNGGVDFTGALTINGFETLNLSTNHGPTAATADKTSVLASLTADKLTKINLSGTSITITNGATTKAVTIDGSALTGILTVGGSLKAGSSVIGSAGKDVFTVGAEGSTYNGGAGDDTVTIDNTVLTPDGTTDAVLIGGAGKDTLKIGNAMTLTDTDFTNVSGFEALTTALTSAVSVTGLAAGAKAAFADGITVTSGTLADDATYTWGSGLYDKAVTLTLASSGDGASTADNIAITTGAGADTVSVTASSWVGADGAAGAITVATGAGNDTINVTTGTLLKVTGAAPVKITGGAGADVITVVSTEADTGVGSLSTTYVIAAGDSTTTAYDSITGFDLVGTDLQSQTLDFASVGLTAYTATAATGYSAAELTVAVSSTGVVTFAGTSAAGLTLAQKIAAVQSVVTTNAGDSAMFTANSNTYVFNNNASGDSVVELVGVSGTGLITTNGDTASTFAGAIFIA